LNHCHQKNTYPGFACRNRPTTDLHTQFNHRCATSKSGRSIKVVLVLLEWQLSGQSTKIQRYDCSTCDTPLKRILCQQLPHSIPKSLATIQTLVTLSHLHYCYQCKIDPSPMSTVWMGWIPSRTALNIASAGSPNGSVPVLIQIKVEQSHPNYCLLTAAPEKVTEGVD
jgi:hypothetical protein